MIPKIIIVHSSEIVRKGLETILKSSFAGEIVTLSSLDLAATKTGEYEKVVIFYESKYYPEIKKLKVQVAQLIAIAENPGAKPENEYESFITLDSTEPEILKWVKDTGIPESRDEGKEGDELTTREREVLQLVARGFSNKMIADKLFISTHTVISHRKNITDKIGIKSISGLTVYAILNRLIDTAEINPEDLI